MQEAFEKVAKDEAIKLRARSYVEKYSLPAVHYRVSRNSFPVEGYVWWVSAVKKHTSWWCAICGERYDCKAPNRLLVVQTFESVNQAEVFRAHAVPQGLCGNLMGTSFARRSVEALKKKFGKTCTISARNEQGSGSKEAT